MRMGLCVWGCLVSFALAARVLKVDPSGGGDYASIQRALDDAAPGDTVLVAPGIYRETLVVRRSGTPEAPVVLESAVRGAAVVRGSEVWRNAWRPCPGRSGVWASPLDTSLLSGSPRHAYACTLSVGPKDKSVAARPATNRVVEADTYLPRTLGQIFIEGRAQTEVATCRALEDGEGTWMVSPDGREIWLHPAPGDLPLAGRQIEWTVRARLLHAARRSLHDIIVRGFTFEHCANQGPFPQKGAVDLCSGHRWILEHNTIRHAKTVGLACGSETWNGEQLTDAHPADRRLMFGTENIVRFNTIADNGVSGIAAWGTNRLRIYNNVIRRNNTGDYGWREKYWDERAGIKIHGGSATIAGNLVVDNEGHGIWCDTGFTGVRISGNTLLNNRRSGIMFESAFGSALVDGNIIAGTRSDGNGFYGGDGIYSHNGSGVTVAHNLFAQNAGAGVRFRTTWGKIGNHPYETSNNRYLNNIFYKNAAGDLMVSATNALSRGTVSEGNVFLANTYLKSEPPLPVRFANYNIGPGKNGFSNLWLRVCAADPSRAMPYGMWRALNQPATLEQWQAVQGLDRTSRAVRGGRFNVLVRDLLLTVGWPEELRDFRVKGLSEITHDFLGRPYPGWGETVCPGPFQMPELFHAPSLQLSIRPYTRKEPPPLRVSLGPANGQTGWMRGKTGAFMHYLFGADGMATLDAFDVEALAAQLAEMKADFFCLTLGQNTGYYLAPNDAYEDIAGYARSSRCSARDIPAALIRALKPHGIRLMLYLPCQTPNQDTAAAARFGFGEAARYRDRRFTPEGVRNWAKVIAWWSRRYGRDIAGWWFDGAYAWLGFDSDVARCYACAAKSGNPQAVVAFNAGVRRPTLPLGSDYMAGEENEPLDVICRGPRNEDELQWHVLTFMGKRWAQPTCRYTDEQWRPWLQAAYEKGGAVMLDMAPVKPTGCFDREQAAQFKRLKEGLKK